MNVQTYLFFDGSCGEAIELYKKAFDAVVDCLVTYAEAPPELTPTGWAAKIFHATIRFGDSLVNMSDSQTDGQTAFGGFAILAHVESSQAAEKAVATLGNDGTVQMPLQPTPWSPCYGIVRDKFGITWKVQS